MIAFAYYLLKVIICSGLLLFYYHIALRNKLFHQWNRFYLLATIILSLLIPCMEFTVWQTNNESTIDKIQLLRVVYSADEYVAEVSTTNAHLSIEQWLAIAYSCVSIVIMLLFVLALARLYTIIRSHAVILINDIKFVNTEEKDSPFSFLNYVFWNKQIELNSPSGEHIFQHELAHVREKHSWDKLFLQIILIGCWCNPFFWLIRKELKMIHEFIADKKSIGQSDAKAFAAMILQATYPKHYNYLTNQFFQSSIKRRLAMLTKKHNPKISYISRILALPLFAFIILAFTIKTRPEEKRNAINLENEITVVIDAGHGGGTGARAEGYIEDDLVLQLAKTIKESNTNNKIKILLTRENEQNVDLNERVEFARKNNADLFISVHLNANPGLAPNASNSSDQARSKGYEIAVSNKYTTYQKQSELLGAALIQEISKSNTTFPNLVKRKVGVRVLDQNICPSVLIECGYITDKNDRDFIIKKANQELVARNILKAIEVYAANQNATGKTSSKYSFQKQNLPDTSKPVKIRLDTETLEDTIDQNFLLIIDGVEKGRAKDVKIENFVSTEQIERLDVLKGESAIKLYGSKGRQGVVLITTKKSNESSVTLNRDGNPVTLRATKITTYGPFSDANNNDEALLIIDGVEKGRAKDLSKFVKDNQIKSITVYKGDEAKKNYGDKGANGVIEVSTKEIIGKPEEDIQRDTTKPTTIFEKVEHETEFPGGQPLWRRYLERYLNAQVPSDKGAPAGQYTVELQFIVNLDGSLSDIKALTKHGYGMEEEAIRALSRGPKWEPAQQNGKTVATYRKQPITFVVSDQ
jgi:TonB-dependent SusC/RagA subfamily outer membrane receptor